MEAHLIDVRDLDGEYIEGVRVLLDYGADRYHLLAEAVERLRGGFGEDGRFYLLDGWSVVAEPGEVGDGRARTWTVPTNQLVTRPSRRA